jgi:hypothetical protein
VCGWCGQGELFGELIKMETQPVGELVDMPIEIVEYLKIYVHLQCVSVNTNGRLVTRDSTGTRYRNSDYKLFWDGSITTGIYPMKNNKNCCGNWVK